MTEIKPGNDRNQTSQGHATNLRLCAFHDANYRKGGVAGDFPRRRGSGRPQGWSEGKAFPFVFPALPFLSER